MLTTWQGMLPIQNSHLSLLRNNCVHTGQVTLVNPKNRNHIKSKVVQAALMRLGYYNSTIVELPIPPNLHNHSGENVAWEMQNIQLGIILTGTLSPCSSCLIVAKGYKKQVQSLTKTRATEWLIRVFVARTMWTQTYWDTFRIIRFTMYKTITRRIGLYFLKHQSETHVAFRKLSRDMNDEVVKYVRSGKGQELQCGFDDRTRNTTTERCDRKSTNNN